MKKGILIIGPALLLLSFGKLKEVIFSVPYGWPQPVYDFKKNPLAQEKIDLGRMLFYEPKLSRDNTISCASCHLPQTAFSHVDHALSHGIDNRIGTRNSPALVNLAWSGSFMWDGAVNHLDMQSLAPIENHLEMDEKIANVAAKLQSSRIYPKLFYEAYGDSLIDATKILKSVSQFMLTVVSCDSKYDRVMQHEKEEHFSESESHGYELFKANCAACHKEPLFTNGKFENNGLAPDADLKDGGRIKVTRKIGDSLKFKVPTLRNIEVSYPYMHDGRYKNLQMVLFHYTEDLYSSPTLSDKLRRKITLNEQDKNDLIAFLKTLTDESFLRNPKYAYPREMFGK